MEQVLEVMQKAVQKTYKNLKHPDFSFVKSSQQERPYEGLIRNLRNHCVIEEITPEEEDVCFSYMVQRAANLWRIDLSMVARFGIFVRLSAKVAAGDFLIPKKSDVTDFEKKIIELIQSRGIILLPSKILEQPLEMTLYNTTAASATYYQALFTDKPAPWL